MGSDRGVASTACPGGGRDALDALAVGINRCKVNWILDADIAGFFDAVSHDWLIRFVEHRVRDRRVIRLIRKWLKAGVMEDGQVTPGKVGTPPASAGAGSRCGDLATPGQHLPALCLRPVGRPVAETPCAWGRHHGALR